MKTSQPARDERSTTRIDVVVILVIIAILIVMLLPDTNGAKRYQKQSACVNNLKQVSLSFRLWEFDNQNSYPMTVPMARGGALEAVGVSIDTWKIFTCMSNDMNTPKILFCPAESDRLRIQANSFLADTEYTSQVSYAGNTNLSYFIGVDAKATQPNMLLAGDHNIGDGSLPPEVDPASLDYSANAASSLQAIGTNITSIRAAWTKMNHKNEGNILFADGSVLEASITSLREAFANTGDAGRTNVIGNWQGNSPFQNRLQFPSLP